MFAAVRAGGGESEGNAGCPSLGSARGDADLVEVKEIAGIISSIFFHR